MNNRVKEIISMLDTPIFGTENLEVVEQVLKLLPGPEFRVELSKDKKFYQIRLNVTKEILTALASGDEAAIDKIDSEWGWSKLHKAMDTARTIDEVMKSLRHAG